jgi:PAS domain S-box-containing protein
MDLRTLLALAAVPLAAACAYTVGRARRRGPGASAEAGTEQRLREAEERFRTLVERVPAVVYIDADDDIASALYMSPQYERMFGYSPEERLADPELWVHSLHPEDRERVLAESDRTRASSEPFVADYRMVRKDGTVVWVRDEARLVTGADGQRTWQGVMYDITEHKRVQQTLQENEQREREAADRLRSLDEMKNTFLAAISHELRSPLTSILGLALTLEGQRLSDEDRDDLLGRLAANSRKLDRLLKDLLDIDRLSRGIVEPLRRLTDVGSLVRRTVEELDSIGQRTVRVRTTSVLASVDPAKVERIVENLVSNALRHTDERCTVWVGVDERTDGVLISVADDGPGIAPQLREAIFEPFRQGPSMTPNRPGTGIGLSLVASFAELHGGRAWVDERPGGGSRFNVLLPFDPTAAEGAGSREAPRSDLAEESQTAPRGTGARRGSFAVHPAAGG